jgi:hypothetical protein
MLYLGFSHVFGTSHKNQNEKGSFLTMKKAMRILLASSFALLLLVSLAFFTLADEQQDASGGDVTSYKVKEVYNMDTLWSTSSTQEIKNTSSYYSHTAEGNTPQILWYAGYDYNSSEESIQVNSVQSNGNSLQWYVNRPSSACKVGDAYIPGHVMSFQIWYEEGNFDGLILNGWFSNLNAYSYVARIETDGTLHTNQNSEVIGQLTEGWNTVSFVMLPNYATDGTTIESFSLYWTLNQPYNSTVISASDLTDKPVSVWTRGSMNSSVAMVFRPIDTNASTDAPASFKVKSFTNATLTVREDVTASFEGYSDLSTTVKDGDSITLPTQDGVLLWKAGDTYYNPGASCVLNATTTFTAVTAANFSSVYLMEEAYNTATLWATASDTNNLNWWNVYDQASEGWSNPTVIFDYSSVYDDANKSVTINATSSTDTSRLKWFVLAPTSTVFQNADGTYRQSAYMSADVWYEAGAFDGLNITAMLQNWTYPTLATITSDGIFQTKDSTVIGTLQEGWNTISWVILPNYSEGSIVSYNIYWMLNQAVSAESISHAEYLAQPMTVWSRGTIDTNAAFQLSPRLTNATEESPASFTIRNLKSYALTETALVTATFGDNADLTVTVPQGSSITLPTVSDVAKWKVNDTLYDAGAAYTLTADTAFTPVTETDLAYAALQTAKEAVETATTETLPAAILALQDALGNALLDSGDEAYIAAQATLQSALTTVTEQITSNLTALDAAETLEEKYTAIMNSIKLYKPLKALLSGDTGVALAAAITDYNSTVSAINADVVEATTTAVAISAYKVTNTEIAAMLADIKSKVTD